jgi:alpha-galactosidase
MMNDEYSLVYWFSSKISGETQDMKSDLLTQLTISAETTKPAKGGGFMLTGPSVSIGLLSTPKQYFYHGWQSWTLTAWVEASRRMPVMRPACLHPMQTDPAYVRDRRPNGSWYGAVEMENGQVIFLGALGLETHVALEGKSLLGWHEAGGGEWFLGMGDEAELFGEYGRLLKEHLGSGRSQKPDRVWCSWYSLYTEIYEAQLLKILNDLGDMPFEVFQIDDGWQKGIGDWEPNAKFPSGMDGMATRIKASGRTPGLWLAPLLAVPSSTLLKEHRDWLLHDQNGQLVSAGFNWGEQLYALDTTHPEALDWLAALMKKVRAWGYDYAKLDFLYAGALPGKRTVDMPREAAYRNGLKVMRESLGDAYFLTCGAPILPSLGLCDGMRIGPDVAGYWDSLRDRDFLGNYAAPGGRNVIRTTLNRLWLQPLVHTDPDVVYFRSLQNALTPDQKSLLQDLAQVAGFKATSDVPAWLTEAERAALRTYMESNPKIQRTGRYKYRIDEREVDFGPFIEMPPMPNVLKNAWGAILGGLADVPAFLKIFDRLSRRSLKKSIEEHPV